MRLILNIVLLAFVSLGCTETKNEYILSKDFVGYVLIIYNQPENSSVQMGTNIFKVPKDGVLKLKAKNNPDWEEIPEFYYETKDKNRKIPFVLDMNKIPSDKVVVSGGSLAKVYSNTNSKEFIEYRIYFVGNNTQTDTFYKSAELLDFESLSKL